MKTMVIGDVHGNSWFFETTLGVAEDNECEAIVQVGDFGLWWPTGRGREFMRTVSLLTNEAQIPYYILDGNHENHGAIGDRVERVMGDRDARSEPIPVFSENRYVYYTPRGLCRQLGDSVCLFMGGAVSVDRKASHRVPYVSWWPQETVTAMDIAYGKAAVIEYKPDVLFTHTIAGEYTPPGMQDINTWGSSHPWYESVPDVQAEQRRLGDLVEFAAKQGSPFLQQYHGHLHHSYDIPHPLYLGMEVTGLGCDSAHSLSWAYRIVDL